METCFSDQSDGRMRSVWTSWNSMSYSGNTRQERPRVCGGEWGGAFGVHGEEARPARWDVGGLYLNLRKEGMEERCGLGPGTRDLLLGSLAATLSHALPPLTPHPRTEPPI